MFCITRETVGSLIRKITVSLSFEFASVPFQVVFFPTQKCMQKGLNLPLIQEILLITVLIEINQMISNLIMKTGLMKFDRKFHIQQY